MLRDGWVKYGDGVRYMNMNLVTDIIKDPEDDDLLGLYRIYSTGGDQDNFMLLNDVEFAPLQEWLESGDAVDKTIAWLARRNAFLRCVNHKHAQAAQTYVDEAEHNDGLMYWDLFEDLDTVLEDFELYLEMGKEVNVEP